MTLARFPRRTLRGGAELYRIHHSDRGRWWFFSNGTGRFDPVGTGVGACYLAEQPLGAWVEVFRREMQLSELALLERSLSSIRLGRDKRLADVTSRRALQFGVTASLGAGEDYGDSQEFASQAADSGFAGIRYFLRHDPAQRLYGIALFGDPGGAAPKGARARAATIPDEVSKEASLAFGYRIVPAP